MGNYKFRLSDMMPNAWFYKLKNGSAQHHPVKNNIKHKHHHYFITTPPTGSATPPPLPYHQTTQISHPRHSYYFNREPYSTKIIDSNDHHHQVSSPTNPKVTDLPYIAAAVEPPRKSSKRSRPKTRRRTVNKQSVSSTSSSCNCRETRESSSSKSDYSAAASTEECAAEYVRVDRNSMSMSVSNSTTTSCSCRVSASTTDIIIDIIDGKKSSSSSSAEKFDGFDPITELELPPIITKAPSKFSQMNKKTTEEPKSRRRKSVSSKDVVHGSLSSKEQQKSSHFVRKSISPGSPGGLKLRSNSPRILTRKLHSKDTTMMTKKPNKQRTITTGAKKQYPTVTAAAKISSCSIPISSLNKNVADSFAIIKSSFDPQRDFRESMVEMIVENNLRKSGDLEELLACYLSLNSNEYHDLIVKVFEQIWFDLTDIHSVSNSCSTSSIV